MSNKGDTLIIRNCIKSTPLPWFINDNGERYMTNQMATCSRMPVCLLMANGFNRIHVGSLLCRDIAKEHTDKHAH